MTIESHVNCGQDLSGLDRTTPVAAERPLGANLAALLDRFTSSVTSPGAHTIGDFAETVGALRGELSMLALYFGAEAYASEEGGFDDIFPNDGDAAPGLDSDYHGIMAAEELEHRCWNISR